MVITNDLKVNYISKEGAAELRNDLDSYKKEKAELMDTLNYLKTQKSTAALPEDIGWQRAQERFQYVQEQIEIITNCLNRSKIIQRPTGKRVQLGSRVRIVTNDNQLDCVIVEPIEADPEKGKISNHSPLGKALLGKSLNEEVEVANPRRAHGLHWKIVNIA